MQRIDEVAAIESEAIAWRRDLHQHPETAYQEHRTGDRVTALLESFGVEVHRGLGGTGVVGRLCVGSSPRAVGLRADLDALAMDEAGEPPWRSAHAGRMHACGHDGHTAMLLAAARALAARRRFDGTVVFVFQPAEENEAGAKRMRDEGLFDRFPVDGVFGLHNMPGLAEGTFMVRPGPMMASADYFWIRVLGAGAHAAYPHRGVDPIPVAAQIVLGLQTITSREVDPTDAAVVSVTQVHAGTALNVLPAEATLTGTLRALRPEVRDRLEVRVREIAEGIATAQGARAEVRIERRYPPTVNTAAEAQLVRETAVELVGADRVLEDLPPSMGAEDFAFLLEARPGAYAWLGAGRDRAMIHSPLYDFNDAVLATGASFWVRLAERALGSGG